MLDITEIPCAIKRKSSASPMTVPIIPSPNEYAILLRLHDSNAHVIRQCGGTLRRELINKDELSNYEKSSLPLTKLVKKFKRQSLSIEAFNEIIKIENNHA